MGHKDDWETDFIAYLKEEEVVSNTILGCRIAGVGHYSDDSTDLFGLAFTLIDKDNAKSILRIRILPKDVDGGFPRFPRLEMMVRTEVVNCPHRFVDITL